jgi:ABC-2 type transport system ATP-binding protein
MLSVQHISKHYGKRPALMDLNFELAEGQFCALLGPNGAGKSTLFQLLTGLFRPDSGDITVGGYSIQKQPTQVLAQIGVVFQQPALDLNLSVRSNLLFHAALHGMARAEALQRMDAECERMGLSADLGRAASELSGGNRRKVELVRALMHQPRLLLMDEATVGLDPKSRQDLIKAVRSAVQEHACSVLWATHWVEEVLHADTLLILHRGKRLAFGAPDEVCRQLNASSLEEGFIAATSSTASANT